MAVVQPEAVRAIPPAPSRGFSAGHLTLIRKDGATLELRQACNAPNKRETVFIRSDVDTGYAEFRKLLDQLQSCGRTHISLITVDQAR